MKILFPLALLALPFLSTPVEAGIRYPNLAGGEYCDLRKAGVDHDQSLEIAVEAGYDYDFVDTQVTYGGDVVSLGSLKMADYINTMCPQYFRNR
tara:strand:- start:479 stop:760 length:282 start_codon:yes stop_codon:yes gene_type:complete